VASASALAPVLLAIVLLNRLHWTGSTAETAAFWAVAAALGVLVLVRSVVQFQTSRRRLAALRVTLDDDTITTEALSHDVYAIPRARVARIVEIEGALGGVRVESEPDPRTGAIVVASVPRGGEGFAEMYAGLERWRTIERRGRRGPAVRVVLGFAIVGAVFFLPFVLDDLVGRSRPIGVALILASWAAMRWTLRPR
jgi:hypothetical protein